MGLDIFFKDDIERTLKGLAAAAEGRSVEYFEALRAMALAFGIEWPRIEVIDTDYLLDSESSYSATTSWRRQHGRPNS